MVNSKLRKKAWSRMEEILDQSVVASPQSRVLHWLPWLLLLLLGSGSAAWILHQNADLRMLEDENAHLTASVSEMQLVVNALESTHAQKLEDLDLKYAAKLSQYQQREKQWLDKLNQQTLQFVVLSSDFQDLQSELTALKMKSSMENKEDVVANIAVEEEHEVIFLPEYKVHPVPEQPMELVLNMSTPAVGRVTSFSPKLFAVAGVTSAPRRGALGGVIEVGVNFFPDSKWSLISDLGITTLHTSIINQTTAAKAGFEAGLTRMAITQEVEEESSRYTDYSFATGSVGSSYKVTPRLKVLGKLKASYILGRANFSKATVEQANGSFLSVSQTLNGLVENNQLNRWGFSGVIGADYTLTDRLGFQVTFNKFLTPLVSQLPLGSEAGESFLHDFTKIGVSYNF